VRRGSACGSYPTRQPATVPLGERQFAAERLAIATVVLLLVALALAAGLVGGRLQPPHPPPAVAACPVH
jgi:hypothetical protein